jgi:hypothetical protein
MGPGTFERQESGRCGVRKVTSCGPPQAAQMTKDTKWDGTSMSRTSQNQWRQNSGCLGRTRTAQMTVRRAVKQRIFETRIRKRRKEEMNICEIPTVYLTLKLII